MWIACAMVYPLWVWVVVSTSMAGVWVERKGQAVTNGNDTVTVIVYAMIEHSFDSQGHCAGVCLVRAGRAQGRGRGVGSHVM